MSYIQFLGNGRGYIYAALPDGSKTIAYIEPNTVQGVRNMRVAGAASAPVIAARSAVGTITFTGVAAGNITAITINGVNQLGAPVAATPSDLVQTAEDVANAINTYAPSGYTFTAEAIGAVVYIYSTPTDGVAVNGLTITVTVSNLSITTTTTAFTGGSNQTGVYDTSVGLVFYLDASISASKTSINVNAEDISRYIVVRGLQSGIYTQSLSVTASAQLLNIVRCSAFTNIKTDTTSSAPASDLTFIDPNGFAEGDVVRLMQADATRVVTVYDANNAPATPANIYLTNADPFSCQDNKSIELRYAYDNNLGPIWIENGRATNQGPLVKSVYEMKTLIAAGSIQVGQNYLIYNAATTATGMYGGVVVTGVRANAISNSGQGVFLVPDYQNSYSLFGGMWNFFMAPPTVGVRYAYEGKMYQSLNGTVASAVTDPTAWALVPFNETNYVLEVDFVEYDIFSNQIVKREDRRGNIISGTNAVQTFKWGCDTCYNNIVLGGTVNNWNVIGEFSSNIISNSSINTGACGDDTFQGNKIYNSIISYGNINGLFTFNFNQLNGQPAYPTIYTIFDDGSANTLNVSLVSNVLNTRAGLSLATSNTSNIIEGNTINGTICSIKTNGNSFRFSFVSLDTNLNLELQKSETGLYINNTESNYSYTLDLDTLLTGTALTLPFASLLAGVLVLTGTSAYTISKLVSVSYYKFTRKIVPDAILGSVTIQPIAVGSAVSGNIVSDDATYSPVTLTYRASNPDFYTVEYVGPGSAGTYNCVNSKIYA
jgi:hypothetical protein